MLKFIEKLSGRRQFSLLSDGDSMLPILQSGDLVYYRKAPYSAIGENDIVLVRKKTRFFTHRVVYKTPSHLITKGDNNLDSDGKIYPDEVLARAIRIKRSGKLIGLDRLYEMQSLLYFREIKRVVSSFKKKGIDAVILKGLPLHLYYEGRRPNRLYADCDILIRRTDAEKAREVMERAGYQKLDIHPSQGKGLMNKMMEDSFVKKTHGFPVIFDIHYETVFTEVHLGRLDPLYPQRLIDRMTETFLRTRKTVTVNGTPFPILAEDCLIPYLMLHLFHHKFRGTFRLSLIRAILEKIGDRDTFRQKTAAFIDSYRLRGFVYPGFLFLKKYYPTPLAPAFLETVKPSPSQCRYIKEHILPYPPFDEGGFVGSGIGFKQLFFLSSEPLWKKGFVFFTPPVLRSILRVGTLKLKRQIALMNYNKTAHEAKI